MKCPIHFDHVSGMQLLFFVHIIYMHTHIASDIIGHFVLSIYIYWNLMIYFLIDDSNICTVRGKANLFCNNVNKHQQFV